MQLNCLLLNSALTLLSSCPSLLILFFTFRMLIAEAPLKSGCSERLCVSAIYTDSSNGTLCKNVGIFNSLGLLVLHLDVMHPVFLSTYSTLLS